MSAELIHGSRIANKIKKQVKHHVEQIENTYDIKPTIATVMVGKNPESSLYLRLRDKACDEVGIHSTLINLSESTTEEKIIKQIKDLNNDSLVHGVLMQLPLPDHLSSKKLFSLLSPAKDVEGFTPQNLGSLVDGTEMMIPCTPLAVLKILEYQNIDLKGKNIAIINHSMVVGKPLAALFLNRNATVSICHVFTKSMDQFTRSADILVSAAGVPGLITGNHLKEDAVVIDVGITKTDSGVCGDVDQSSVKSKASMITPVPGGVGPVTVACSLLNMVKTIENCVDD